LKKRKKTTEVQVGKEITDKAKKSDRFYTELTESGRPIFYFQQPGDYVKGRLIGTTTAIYQFYSQRIYKIEAWEIVQYGQIVPVEEDHIIEIVAYRDLQRIIDRCELMGSIVRIKMIGRLRTSGGHFRFVWEVYKDMGTFTENEVKQIPKTRKKRKAEKHG